MDLILSYESTQDHLKSGSLDPSTEEYSHYYINRLISRYPQFASMPGLSFKVYYQQGFERELIVEKSKLIVVNFEEIHKANSNPGNVTVLMGIPLKLVGISDKHSVVPINIIELEYNYGNSNGIGVIGVLKFECPRYISGREMIYNKNSMLNECCVVFIYDEIFVIGVNIDNSFFN